MGSLIRPYLFHIVVAVLAVSATGGLVWYIRHGGVVAERGAQAQVQLKSAKEQLKTERKAVADAVETRKKQVKEASHVRKEVDDAYRSGDVPERVRRFYID